VERTECDPVSPPRSGGAQALSQGRQPAVVGPPPPCARVTTGWDAREPGRLLPSFTLMPAGRGAVPSRNRPCTGRHPRHAPSPVGHFINNQSPRMTMVHCHQTAQGRPRPGAPPTVRGYLSGPFGAFVGRPGGWTPALRGHVNN